MKIIRYILFPVMPIYFAVTWLRNVLYDFNIKTSKSYSFPVVCVGNLSTGGTGKTPMIEYLIRLLKADYKLATLSRGYKRSTKGFVLASDDASVSSIGDEPFQFYKKFGDEIKVAVDADRQSGIAHLRKLKLKPDIILLDDAYQHRKVNAKVNVLLTSYHNLFCKDMVLPTGDLREPRTGAKRAQIIVVTKCPIGLSDAAKNKIVACINPKPYQKVFFSYISYSEHVHSDKNTQILKTLPPFTLVTGIANATPLLEHLDNLELSYEHLSYSDHYNFNANDIKKLKEKSLIVTTEKDYVRLEPYEALKQKLFYLPIEMSIDHGKSAQAFDELIKELIEA